jgi:hypothetical protein
MFILPTNTFFGYYAEQMQIKNSFKQGISVVFEYAINKTSKKQV